MIKILKMIKVLAPGALFITFLLPA